MSASLIIDELESADSLGDFLMDMAKTYGIAVTYGMVKDTKVILLTMPECRDEYCAIHDECDLMLISEQRELIAKSLPRIYKYNTELYTDLFQNVTSSISKRPIFVEEKIPGIQVCVSKYNSELIVTTKNSIHATELFPGEKINTIETIVKEELKKSAYFINLFSDAWFPHNSLIFQLTHPSNTSYKLYLLGAVNMNDGKEIARDDVTTIAKYFNLHRPKKVVIYEETQIADAIYTLLDNDSTINAVILSDPLNNRICLPISTEMRIGLWGNKYRKHILDIANDIMLGATPLACKTSELIYKLKSSRNKLKNDVSILFNTHKKQRTRKKYAACVKSHPLAKVLFALRDNKITSIDEFYKVITPLEFINAIGANDTKELRHIINNYKE